MKISMVRVVSFTLVNLRGAETGQLLAELLCPWILGFSAPPFTQNSTLSLTVVNVHTCLHLGPYAHTQRHTWGPYVQTRVHEHTLREQEKYKLTNYLLQHLFKISNPSCPADVMQHSHMHMHTYP